MGGGEEEEKHGPLLRMKLLAEGMIKSSVIRAPCNHVNLAVGPGAEFTLIKSSFSDITGWRRCSAS